MADRIFGCIALAIALGYGFIAFTIIEAPFQYDPLGPETWPQILSVFACLCCLYIIILPDGTRMKVLGSTLMRIAILLILLSAYAYLYEPIGFILSTTLFCLVLSRILGGNYLSGGCLRCGFGHNWLSALCCNTRPESAGRGHSQTIARTVMNEVFAGLYTGFGVALAPMNLLYVIVGLFLRNAHRGPARNWTH